ncbi:MAG: hypothetical protein H7320_24030 [Ferruginibacter sp.]|nr:hypothetical protein [Ferruginibacter sp.]
MTITKHDRDYVFELALAITVAASMLLYGIGKPTQFSNTIIFQKKIADLTGMELMWAFYGYTKTYPVIIGVFEIIGGLLLVVGKTRIIGAGILTAILLNVILQDVFYGVNEGALKAAMIYQLLIVVILYCRRKLLLATVGFYLQQIKTTTVTFKKQTLLVVIGFVVAVGFKIIESFLTH